MSTLECLKSQRKPLINKILFSCSDCSTFHTCVHHCCQSRNRNSSTCGQLCSYWRLSYRVSSRICVFDTTSVWMGKPTICSCRVFSNTC